MHPFPSASLAQCSGHHLAAVTASEWSLCLLTYSPHDNHRDLLLLHRVGRPFRSRSLLSSLIPGHSPRLNSGLSQRTWHSLTTHPTHHREGLFTCLIYSHLPPVSTRLLVNQPTLSLKKRANKNLPN